MCDRIGARGGSSEAAGHDEMKLTTRVKRLEAEQAAPAIISIAVLDRILSGEISDKELSRFLPFLESIIAEPSARTVDPCH